MLIGICNLHSWAGSQRQFQGPLGTKLLHDIKVIDCEDNCHVPTSCCLLVSRSTSHRFGTQEGANRMVVEWSWMKTTPNISLSLCPYLTITSHTPVPLTPRHLHFPSFAGPFVVRFRRLQGLQCGDEVSSKSHLQDAHGYYGSQLVHLRIDVYLHTYIIITLYTFNFCSFCEGKRGSNSKHPMFWGTNVWTNATGNLDR